MTGRLAQRINVLAAIAVIGFALTGCATISTPPQPMSHDELMQAVNKATPEQQIDWYRRSPFPADVKAAKIKEIQDKYHLSPDAAGGNTPDTLGGR